MTVTVVGDADLAWLEANGWQVAHDLEIAPNTPVADRSVKALNDAIRKLTEPEGAELFQRSRTFQRMRND
ncbi:MAG: hypothetical protein WD448_01590 [Woeseia sp.]